MLSGIINKDSDQIEKLFSIKALSECADIKEGMDYLFGLVSGDLVSWERESMSPQYSRIKGYRSEKVYAFYNVETTNGKYVVFVADNPVDEFDPENVGLYSLRVVKAENQETQLTKTHDMEIPGIFFTNGE